MIRVASKLALFVRKTVHFVSAQVQLDRMERSNTRVSTMAGSRVLAFFAFAVNIGCRQFRLMFKGHMVGEYLCYTCQSQTGCVPLHGTSRGTRKLCSKRVCVSFMTILIIIINTSIVNVIKR